MRQVIVGPRHLRKREVIRERWQMDNAGQGVSGARVCGVGVGEWWRNRNHSASRRMDSNHTAATLDRTDTTAVFCQQQSAETLDK